MATIDTKTGIRSCYQALGPVCIFGPNNFPFAFGSISGGDFAARRLLVDDAADAARFHLVDAPKSPLWNGGGYGPAGEDGGERIRDIPPEGGTLVLFDSVSLPHEVMPTVGRERFALSGWFHEAVLS